jgi:hypothetical protein
MYRESSVNKVTIYRPSSIIIRDKNFSLRYRIQSGIGAPTASTGKSSAASLQKWSIIIRIFLKRFFFEINQGTKTYRGREVTLAYILISILNRSQSASSPGHFAFEE